MAVDSSSFGPKTLVMKPGRFKMLVLPNKATSCGVPEALVVMLRLPLRGPAAVGVKVTLTVQFAAAAMLVPQVLVWAKSPVAAMAVTVTALAPVLVSVTVWTALVVPTATGPKNKIRVDCCKPSPTPYSGKVKVPSGAPDAMDRVPVCPPAEIGENVTLMVQLAPAARLVPQVLVSAKGALVVMPVMLTAVAAVLVIVVVWAALVVPTP